MRVRHPSARLEWKTIAVMAGDPVVFAQELQNSLQELTNGGYILTGQMQRGDALIITASRVQLAASEAQTEAPPPTRHRQIVEAPRMQGHTSEETLYHYSEDGVLKQLFFPTLVDALRLLNEHVHTGTGILPVSITTISKTRFEPTAFGMLLKMFAEDLPCPPG